MAKVRIPYDRLVEQLFPGAKIEIISIERDKKRHVWEMVVEGDDVPNVKRVTAVVVQRHVILQAVDEEEKS